MRARRREISTSETFVKAPVYYGGFLSFCFGLAFLHNLPANFAVSRRFLWQEFFTVADVISASSFLLLNHFGNIIHAILIQPFVAVFGIITLSHFKLLTD